MGTLTGRKASHKFDYNAAKDKITEFKLRRRYQVILELDLPKFTCRVD